MEDQIYYQLHCVVRKKDDNSFGIVISPRKALCVNLTDSGFERMKNYEACAKGDFKDYAASRIESSMKTFYCQIPFKISNTPCCVMDLRKKEEVVGRLRSFIPSASKSNFW